MSSSFNPLERTLARLLSRMPILKRIAKRTYTLVVYILKRKNYKVRLNEQIPALEYGDKNTFFGYYDKSPINKDTKYVIYQQSDTTTSVKPKHAKEVSICLNQFPSNIPVQKFVSKAFNWQQGTKLQWINHKQFIFNDVGDKGDYVSVVVDVEANSIVRVIERPIYDCFADQFAISLSFERLSVFSPDYGYFAKPVAESELLPIDVDGIFYIDLQTGEHRLELSLKTIATFEPLEDFKIAKHTVNHLMISPDGTKFMFIHRWFVSGRRFDRLLLADFDEGLRKVLSSNEMVSHCFWYGNDKVLGYLRHWNGKDSYWIIDCNTSEFFRLENLDQFGDGHPHVNGDWFVTDTYPDRSRMQHLLAVNLQTGELRELGEFFHGFRYDAETRCDLHPRFSPNGNFVFFDSVSSGHRRFCWIEFKP